MKNIKLNSTTNNSADKIISEIEGRAKRQSRIYRLGFIVTLFVITSYILNSMSVMEYDGYIYHKDIRMRTISNIAIVDYYVKPGDIVNEGDTLYSYLMVDWLEAQVNPYSENLATEKKTESDLRIAKYESEIIEINNNIDSLQSTINTIKSEILSGVKTEDEVVSLNLELSERVERAKHFRRAIAAEYEMQTKYENTVFNTTSVISQGLAARRANLKKYGAALRYRVAYVDSKIIDVKAAVGMLTLEEETVLTFQPIGHPEMTNSHVEMVVEADRYVDITDGMEVDVYVGGDFLCEANVSFLGARMADAYANIELLLDRTTDINGKLMIALDFKEGYVLPDKYYIHNYPVEIRHRVWGDLSDIFDWNQWIKKGEDYGRNNK